MGCGEPKPALPCSEILLLLFNEFELDGAGLASGSLMLLSKNLPSLSQAEALWTQIGIRLPALKGLATFLTIVASAIKSLLSHLLYPWAQVLPPESGQSLNFVHLC
jgi:hypothetical protein